MPNTIAITMLDGSNKIDVVPAQASAQLDIRLLPSENPQHFLEDLRRFIGDDSIRIDSVFSKDLSSSSAEGFLFDVVHKRPDSQT